MKGSGRMFFILGLSFVLLAAGGIVAEGANAPRNRERYSDEERYYIAQKGRVFSVDDARVKELAALLPVKPQGFGRGISNRAAWDRLAQCEPCRKIIAEAEALLEEPIPQFDAELFKDYYRKNAADDHDQRMRERRNRLDALVKAECLENKGRFLKPIEDVIEVYATDITWVNQGHDINFYNIDGLRYEIELRVAELAGRLATIDYILGDKLSDLTRQLIRREVNKRALGPFLAMLSTGEKRAFWLERTSNWNAVCLSGVTEAALTLLESPQERAMVLAAVEHYIQHYIRGFIDDGYCVEGISYWNFGFGNYITLAQTIKEATNGQIDMLSNAGVSPAIAKNAAETAAILNKAPAKIRKIAQMPFRLEMLPGIYPYFSDCKFGYTPDERNVAFVSRRYGFGHEDRFFTQKAFSEPYCGYDFDILASLGKHPKGESDEPPPTPPIKLQRTWFDKHGVLICRPGPEKQCRMAVALKGGHNDEEKHNHNDVGTFVVAVGNESLIVDPGLELYSPRSVGRNRYDSAALSSHGHCAPVVAGKLQKYGRDAEAKVLKTEFTDVQDTLVFDISSAYEVETLQKLQRTYVYSRRGAGELTVTDEVHFSRPERFGTALITFSQWRRISPRVLLIQGEKEMLRVEIAVNPAAQIEIAATTIEENYPTETLPTRLGINLKDPVEKCTISIKIYPGAAELTNP